MTTFYVRQNQRIVSDYIAAGGIWPASKAEIAEWALEHKRWQPSREDILRLCGDALTTAMAEEVFTDEQGRTVRAKMAARTERDGTRGTFWHDVREAPIAFLRIGVTQRRNAIAAECYHLSNVVNYSNDHHQEQIELDLDFARDVRELGQSASPRSTVASPRLDVQVHPGLADMAEAPSQGSHGPSRGSRVLPFPRPRRERPVVDGVPPV